MKKIVGTVAWRACRPPEESIVVEGIAPEDAHIQNWSWVDSELLLRCVIAIFSRQGKIWPPDIAACRFNSPRTLFTCYGHLDVDQSGDPVYTWANAKGVTIKGSPPFGDEWLKPFKVPLRLSNGILSLAEQGIMHVTVERVPIPGPIYHYFHLGHTADGTTYELLDAGRRDGSYRAVTWRPPLKGALAEATES